MIHRIASKIHQAIVHAGRGCLHVQGPPETLHHPFTLKRRQPTPAHWEALVLRAHLIGKPGRGFSALDAVVNRGGCHGSFAPLGEWAALLAMKDHRAPWLVFRNFERALIRHGLTDNTGDLGDLARRYLFLGDPQMLLTESGKRPAPVANSLELVKKFSTERQTQPQVGVRYQCP